MRCLDFSVLQLGNFLGNGFDFLVSLAEDPDFLGLRFAALFQVAGAIRFQFRYSLRIGVCFKNVRSFVKLVKLYEKIRL